MQINMSDQLTIISSELQIALQSTSVWFLTTLNNFIHNSFRFFPDIIFTSLNVSQLSQCPLSQSLSSTIFSLYINC